MITASELLWFLLLRLATGACGFHSIWTWHSQLWNLLALWIVCLSFLWSKLNKRSALKTHAENWNFTPPCMHHICKFAKITYTGKSILLTTVIYILIVGPIKVVWCACSCVGSRGRCHWGEGMQEQRAKAQQIARSRVQPRASRL